MKYGCFVLALFLFVSIPVAASDVLYRGAGVEIPIARRGDVVLDAYPSPIVRTSPFLWLSHQGAKDYYGFPLVINRGVTTVWTPETSVTITYESGGDTLRAKGGECVFFSADLKTVIHSWDRRFINIPGERIFMTPAKEPVVWSRFDFEEYPDEIISCRPVNLLTRGGD